MIHNKVSETMNEKHLINVFEKWKLGRVTSFQMRNILIYVLNNNYILHACHMVLLCCKEERLKSIRYTYMPTSISNGKLSS